MDEDKLTELVMKISTELAALNANLKNALEKLNSHENRITALETQKHDEKQDDWRSQLIMLLAKAIVIGGVSIAALSGASGIIAKIFGVE